MKSHRYQYDRERSAKEKMSSALCPIANELSKIGINDPGVAPGALKALAMEVKEGMPAIAGAIEGMDVQKRGESVMVSGEDKALVPVEERTVEFYGDEIKGGVVMDSPSRRVVYVPAAPLCDFLGIDTPAQR